MKEVKYICNKVEECLQSGKLNVCIHSVPHTHLSSCDEAGTGNCLARARCVIHKLKVEHPLKGKYFFIVYKIHPYMCRDSSIETKCINEPPDKYISKLYKDNVERDTYTLIDYVELTKDEYDKQKLMQKGDKEQEEEDEEW